MKDAPVPYLCGGTFFVLLTEAKGKTLSRRQLRKRKTDIISNKNMLEALIQMMMPSFVQPPSGRTFDGDTTDYRSCKVSYGENLPFDDEDEIRNFDNRIKTDYSSVLSCMDDFIVTFLKTDSEAKMDRLLYALLTLIEDDELIMPKTPFYLSSAPIEKKDLLALDHYCLSALLLGIWHFIIMNRHNNEKGRATFEKWHKRAEEIGARWKFVSTIGKSYPREIDYDLISDDVDSNAENNAAGGASEAIGTAYDEPEKITGEIVDPPYIEKTIEKDGRTYNQKAEKIYNIEHIENFYG